MKTAPTNTVMLLTPPGGAAIAVVRVTGELVAPFLAAHFSRAVAPLRCVHGDLRDERGEVIDDALVVLHEDGRAADINVHGGPWVIESAVALAQRHGFTYVPPASPPDGAQLHPPADAASILDREVWAAAPLARTEQGLRVLLAQPQAWADLVARAQTAPADLPAMIKRILVDNTLDCLLRPRRVVLVGPANVGKSTLANQLFAQERSITADLPGTTRDWIGELANIDGLPVLLFDTPGLRESSDPIEREAVGKVRALIRSGSLMVWVSAPDAQHPVPRLGPILGPVIEVMNKADLLPDEAAQGHACPTVATTGQGIERLRRLIRVQLGCGDLDPSRPRCWTDRQTQILLRALKDPTCLGEIVGRS